MGCSERPSRAVHDNGDWEPVAHPKAVTMGRAAIGIDLGQKRDPTAVAVVEAKEREDPQTGAMADHYVTRHVERLALGTAYPAVAQRLSAIVENVQTRARPQDRLTPPIWLDATGVGQPVVPASVVARAGEQEFPVPPLAVPDPACPAPAWAHGLLGGRRGDGERTGNAESNTPIHI
jgi:hypothetical protein